MWNGRKVSLIFPTYNEKDSIKEAIEDYQYQEIIDEIIVINNNAAEGTSEEVAKTTAKEVFEIKQGYGAAIRRGLVRRPEIIFLSPNRMGLLKVVILSNCYHILMILTWCMAVERSRS